MKLQSFINGLLVGFTLGVLYAPARGEETRRKIARKASDVKDSIKTTYNDVASNVSDNIDRVKNTADNLLNKGERKFNEATADQ
jgi:gas vesicle protein